MTKAGDCFVRFCTSVHTLPAEILCVILFATQASVMDYFLVTNLSIVHLTWIAPDVLNSVLLIRCMYMSYSSLYKNEQQQDMNSFAWISWFLINVVVAAKTIFIFNKFPKVLTEEDPSFFGPNTLKTSIALGSCVFILLLTTQHDAPLGSDRRRYIEELTGTTVFDILDTVDILEILFDGDKTGSFWKGLYEFILGVATINLLIPTVPLLILSRTHFGYCRLQLHLVYVHRLLMVVAVNVPNLLVRFIVWHGFSGAISPFSLKNIILISMTFYEFYLHKKTKYEMHEKEQMQMANSDEEQPEISTKGDNCPGSILGVASDDKKTDDRFQTKSLNIETHL